MTYVDLSVHGFIIEPRYYFYGWWSSPTIWGRISAVNALIEARARLPRNHNFKIWDMKRSRNTQMLMRNSFRRRLRIMHPGLAHHELEALVTPFGAKLPRRVVKPGSHILGGAVDLTIVDPNGVELYMGTDHDDLTPRAALDHFETSEIGSVLDREARKNRRLLKKTMLSAGFEPYSLEWWHWSYDE